MGNYQAASLSCRRFLFARQPNLDPKTKAPVGRTKLREIIASSYRDSFRAVPQIRVSGIHFCLPMSLLCVLCDTSVASVLNLFSLLRMPTRVAGFPAELVLAPDQAQHQNIHR